MPEVTDTNPSLATPAPEETTAPMTTSPKVGDQTNEEGPRLTDIDVLDSRVAKDEPPTPPAKDDDTPFTTANDTEAGLKKQASTREKALPPLPSHTHKDSNGKLEDIDTAKASAMGASNSKTIPSPPLPPTPSSQDSDQRDETSPPTNESAASETRATSSQTDGRAETLSTLQLPRQESQRPISAHSAKSSMVRAASIATSNPTARQAAHLEPPTRKFYSVRRKDSGMDVSQQQQQRTSFASSIGAGSIRQLTADEEALSLKVRSMYDTGYASDTSMRSFSRSRRSTRTPGLTNSMAISDTSEMDGGAGGLPQMVEEQNEESSSDGDEMMSADEGEMKRESALEDWEDLENVDIDRFGFILPKGAEEGTGNMPTKKPSIHFKDSATPRRQKKNQLNVITQKLNISNASPPEMLQSPCVWEKEEMKAKEITRAAKWTQMAHQCTIEHARKHKKDSRGSNTFSGPPTDAEADAPPKKRFQSFRNTTRKLRSDSSAAKQPPNLTPAPTSSPFSFSRTNDPSAPPSIHNQSSLPKWEFNTKDPKLVSRVWKGIPDCWRAAAWHSFLATSARKRGGAPDEEIIDTYHQLLDHGSPDDVQIDLDVPRTISSHILFRRRYQGGQRLLFRVLHALSLYFPQVGYVQGMASPAATLLCYFDEDLTFVMLVRLFEFRGLATLFAGGFDGLIDALEEFDKRWMKGADLSTIRGRLEELGITNMTFGAKWYLTLFGYSIPFPAQLRVWDVFMLLGDPVREHPTYIQPPQSLFFQDVNEPSPPTTAPREPRKPNEDTFGGTLDVLHATSAALIDGMKDVLLKEGFEECMQAITSWIPIKDEDLLMRVVKVEWKANRRRQARRWGLGGKENVGGWRSQRGSFEEGARPGTGKSLAGTNN